MMDMICLSRGMMERWDISENRPACVKNVLFGADDQMLVTAHLLSEGSLCITSRAEQLNAQDCMYTMLVRDEAVSEEVVVQKITASVDPEKDFDMFLASAQEPAYSRIVIPAYVSDIQLALAARFLYARFEARMTMPEIMIVSSFYAEKNEDSFITAVKTIVEKWPHSDAFSAWILNAKVENVFLDGLFGFMDESECKLQQAKMNYSDSFLMWSEPSVRLLPKRDTERHARIFLSVSALTVAAGWFCGNRGYADVLKDEELRDWIGHVFKDEILPFLPWKREEISQDVITAFERLENTANDARLLSVLPGKYLMKNLVYTLIPAVRAYAEENYDTPPLLSLGIAALFMMYAGARRDKNGSFTVHRGEESELLTDVSEILESFSRFAHDMPGESLAYAVLADRGIWGCDLREIDGFEMRIASDLSSIQRIGFRETLKNKMAMRGDLYA